MVFTERQEALVKEAWKAIEPNVDDLSLRFFATILELDPGLKEKFSFLKNAPPIPTIPTPSGLPFQAPQAPKLPFQAPAGLPFQAPAGAPQLPMFSPKLKAHAVAVFRMICETAIQLREKGELILDDLPIKNLGIIHLQNNTEDEDFPVYYNALKKVLRLFFGDKWTPELEDAWSEAHTQLINAIQRAMELAGAPKAAT